MRIAIEDDFDLAKIAESGQCFRWTRCADGSWLIPYRRSRLRIARVGGNEGDACDGGAGEQAGGVFEVDCAGVEFSEVWRGYFDFDEDYRAIRSRIDPADDPFLFEAAEAQRGIRILRQDLWEVIVSFIISQNRNIPAIKRSVELLCEAAGEWVADRGPDGGFYAFPSPEAVCALDGESLARCRLGYREGYVRAAAESVASGAVDLEALRSTSDDEAFETLLGMRGIGIKVASCIALFGLHRVNAFPIDTWIKKVLAREYPDGFPFERYEPYNGICQQYLFAHYRTTMSD